MWEALYLSDSEVTDGFWQEHASQQIMLSSFLFLQKKTVMPQTFSYNLRAAGSHAEAFTSQATF